MVAWLNELIPDWKVIYVSELECMPLVAENFDTECREIIDGHLLVFRRFSSACLPMGFSRPSQHPAFAAQSYLGIQDGQHPLPLEMLS